MRVLEVAAVASLVLAVTGCGGGGDGPTPPPDPPVFTSLTVSPGSATLRPQQTQQLTPTALDQRGSAIQGVSGFTYVSSDESKAMVSSGGLVTAVAVGTSTITVALTRDGVTKTAAAAITVNDQPAPAAAIVAATAQLAFEPASVEVAVGGTVTWQFALLHNVTFSGSNAPQSIPSTASGSVARVFPVAGTFPYTCTLHAGMNGTVSVR